MIVAATSLVHALPWLASAIAIATFVASQREFRRRAKLDYVNDLEKRISALESEKKDLSVRVAECEADRQELREENYGLMRRLLVLEKGQS